jgi:RNA polymerase sigma-70 factor, ECF subfamily
MPHRALWERPVARSLLWCAGKGMAPMPPTFDVACDPFTRGIICRKVRQIIKRPGFSEQDFEALEQMLLTQVIQAMPSFNAEIAHQNVFITTVVERYVRTILTRRSAMKRGPSRVRSLNALVVVPNDAPTQLQNTLEESTRDARLQIERRTSSNHSELVADMAAVISSLPEPWRQMLELSKSHSIVQISEQMKVPRSTLRHWMKRVNAKFEAEGLREYLA